MTRYCVWRVDTAAFLDLADTIEATTPAEAIRRAVKRHPNLTGAEFCALPALAFLIYGDEGQPLRDLTPS